ncbi:hypothetical protein KUTeg_003636 [Tegillarca granosa]|uniref:U3 small nucleolar RNA-associated protein 13 C-terminal domain-containing protein n=1 Tax=Tegillarca granosa TaxID=220873 RepID=A0ABQ9FMR4_TEGGR|nr:hypothetical protein KUTeg_003636 [Tegillarca granosa]
MHDFICTSNMTHLKSNFGVQTKHEAFYTGGKIQISKDGECMFCGCGNKIQVVDIKSGEIQSTIGQVEDEEITGFTLTPDDKYLVLATQNLLLRQWNWEDKVLIRTWKAVHVSPISTMSFDPTSTLLATGGTDSTIKLWDIEKQYCTHNLKGHQGVVSVAEFHPDIQRLQLISAAEDYKVRIWDLKTSRCIAEIEVHYSIVTSLSFSMDGNTMYSCGRDSVVVVWNIKELKVIKTIPVFEALESVVLLPEKTKYPNLNMKNDRSYVMTAGSKGVLKIWDVDKAKCVFSQKEAVGKVKETDMETDATEQNIIQAFYTPCLNTVTVVTFDHNISVFNLDDLQLKKQFCGYTDEVLDIQFLGENDSHIVVATNSERLQVYELSTWDCQILQGHTDIILSVCVHKTTDLIASSSKDNSIRLWNFNASTGKVYCVAVGYGHTHAVGSTVFNCLSRSFLVSGGQDSTLKMWTVPKDLNDEEVIHLHSTITEKAHEKDINSIAVAPNDKFVATGSQDRLAKLWKAEDLSLIGVLRGHKRGIWCVQFSPVDQVLATSSGDGTIKIWSLSDFTCVKTFEGHDSSVLKVNFLCRGMQLLSCGSDGLVKLWTIKSNECIKTLDEHQDKIWALAINKNENIAVTGGADSTIILWKDITKEEKEEKQQQQEEFILKEQELCNLIQQKKYLKAIGLAITLEQPYRVLSLFKDVLSEENGSVELENTLSKLRLDQIDALLRFSTIWNTNSKHCHEAQFVVSTVLKSYPASEIAKFPNSKSNLEGLLPYTERHLQRMNRLIQQATFVDYTWKCMRTVAGDSTSYLPVIDTDSGIAEVNKSQSDGQNSSGSSDENDENESDKISSDNDNVVSAAMDDDEEDNDSDDDDDDDDDDDESMDTSDDFEASTYVEDKQPSDKENHRKTINLSKGSKHEKKLNVKKDYFQCREDGNYIKLDCAHTFTARMCLRDNTIHV